MFTIYNCHTHIFTIDHVPDKFLPFSLVRSLVKNRDSENLARILHNILRRDQSDVFDRYASFLSQGKDPTQEAILQSMMDFYPDNTKFVILTMDMEYMKAGNPKTKYIEQLEEVVMLLKRYPDRIYPFVFADPRREDILDLVKKYIERGFKGIKIYPPLGYFPFEKKLLPVFEYAIEQNLPVMTHCSTGGVYTREKKEALPRKHPMTGEPLEWTNRKEYVDYFTDPDNYLYLLHEYKDLKICFGHFGGMNELRKFRDSIGIEHWGNSWFNKIRKLLKKYPNTYADISYTLSDLSLVPLININLLSDDIANKILFGTDFYMNKIEGNEFKFTVELRNALGEKNFEKIANVNPEKYLN